MVIRYVDKGNPDNYDGIVLIINDIVEHSINKNFEILIENVSKRKNISVTTILGEGVQVFFKKENNIISISENRIVDKYRLSMDKENIFKLILKHFK